MAQFSEPDRTQILWAAALRDAAGILSAYITPIAYALENVSVQLVPDSESDGFVKEIKSRLDLGRANAFLQLMQESELVVTTAYRHVLSRSKGAIRGKIDVPRFILGRARNEKRGIPVILASRQITTPENLLVSEVFRLCFVIAEQWKYRGGAEAKEATRLWNGLQTYESTFPWNELRSKARPSLSELIEVVKGRLRTGQVMPGSFYQEIALLFSKYPKNLRRFEKATTPLLLLLTQSPNFEDRVFELLCLSWIISTIRKFCLDVVVNPSALYGSNKGPVATGWFGGKKLTLFYQQSANLLPIPIWIDRRTQMPFRAIPDIVLKISSGINNSFMILDAKNRTLASESEVAYKLMGYKENLGIVPFISVGIFPSFSNKLRLRRFETVSGDQILLVHVPLSNGRHTVQRIGRLFLRALAVNPNMERTN